jgi:hypothetical protein
MGILRGIGKFAGTVAGFVVGGPIQIVGELTGIQLVEEIGIGVRKASSTAGDTLGQVADGAYNTVSGMVQADEEKRNVGLKDMGNAVEKTAKGVYYTAKNTIHSGTDVVAGLIDGDHDRAKSGASSIVKTVAVGALAIGVIDFIDGADGIEADADGIEADADGIEADADVATDTHPGDHYVNPNHVDSYVRSDGTVVDGYWRDGDGDTSVDKTSAEGGGYMQSNPSA